MLVVIPAAARVGILGVCGGAVSCMAMIYLAKSDGAECVWGKNWLCHPLLLDYTIHLVLIVGCGSSILYLV